MYWSKIGPPHFIIESTKIRVETAYIVEVRTLCQMFFSEI